MIEAARKWISISLYSQQNYWGELLRGTIEFLEDKYPGYQTKPFILSFNYDKGPNIQLCFLSPIESEKRFAEQADQYYKSIFLGTNFKNDQSEAKEVYLFARFPSNTIQYGLHHPMLLYQHNEVDFTFQIDLSNFLISALITEETISSEALFTLAFHMQMALIYHTATTGNISLHHAVKDISPHMHIVTGYAEGINAESIFIANKFAFIDITKKVMAIHSYSNFWLKPWIELYIAELKRKKNNGFLRLAGSQLNKQLGLNNDEQLLLAYFLKRSITTI